MEAAVLYHPLQVLRQGNRDDREPLLSKRFRDESENVQVMHAPSWFQTTNQTNIQRWPEQQVEQTNTNQALTNSKQAFLRLPELIDTLAKDEKVLRWDPVQQWFEVIDGPLFEDRFNALRCIRGKRREDAVDRPFARMHIHFVLARGDKWAGTGSAFRPKGDTVFKGPAPSQFPAGSSEMYFPKIEDELKYGSTGLKFEQGTNATHASSAHIEKRWKPSDGEAGSAVDRHENCNFSAEINCHQRFGGLSGAWDSTIPAAVST